MGSITPMDTTTMSMLLAMAGPQGWAELPTGILHAIIHLLSSTRDVLAFIATCPTWRAAFMEAKPTFCEQQAPPTSHDPKLRPVKQRCPPLWCSFAIVIRWIGSEVGAWMKTCSFCYDSSCRINGRIFLIFIKIFLIFMRIFIIFSLNF